MPRVQCPGVFLCESIWQQSLLRRPRTTLAQASVYGQPSKENRIPSQAGSCAQPTPQGIDAGASGVGTDLFRRGRRESNEWCLLIITSISRNKEENRVEAEFLEDRDTIRFKCSSSVPILQVGDFISKKGHDISFLHQETLTPIVFTIGSVVAIPRKQNAAPKPAPQAVPKVSRLTKEQIAERLEGFGRVVRSRRSK